MASSQFIPSPVPHYPHYECAEQPGVIVPPNSTSTLTVPCSNPSLSNSPCPECALHSTILQSMTFNMSSNDYTACQHLHASSSCSSCYSNYQLQQQRAQMGHGQHSHQVFRGPCGHLQQCYDPRNTQPHPNGSYPNFQYHDWSRPGSSNEGGTFLPPPPNIAPMSNCSDVSPYPPMTSSRILTLPSPTFSIPPISPFLPNSITNIKDFDLPPMPGLSTSEASASPHIELANCAQKSTAQRTHIKENAKSDLESLPSISGIKITEIQESKPDIKLEKLDNNNNTKRKLQKTPSDKRRSKNGEGKSSEVRKRQPEDLCQVCGDRASGYHYNALTCEGCKGFFRRSITNKTSYKQGCKQGGNCEMDTYTRRKCPHCRLKKCKEVGMLEECLLTEIQCQSKRRRRKQKQQEQIDDVKQQDETSQSTTATSPGGQSSAASSPWGSDSSQNGDNGVSLVLTEEESNLIKTVSEAFKDYKINPDIVRRWEKYINNESKTTCRLSDITNVHVQVLVQYAKNLPGFITLDPEDQIALLKGSVFEAMLIRNSCGYHHLTREINIPAIVDELGIEVKKIHSLLDFFTSIGKLQMDEIEYAFLIAIVVFNSDYPYVKNKAIIEEIQNQYLSALAKYSMTREPIRPSIFAKILASLTEIRSLSHNNSEIVASWKKRGALTPLLCEIWDLD